MKSIRTRSIPNVEDDRLTGRLAYVRANLPTMMRSCEQKNDLRARVREVVNIERELTRRGIVFEPVTNGAHLRIDVHTTREVRP